jgi:hypothetical protein
MNDIDNLFRICLISVIVFSWTNVIYLIKKLIFK